MTLALDVPAIADSPLSRMDPRWKLAALVPAAILLALVRTVPPAAAALILALVLAQRARLPGAWLARRLAWTALFIGLFLIWLMFLPDPNGDVRRFGWLSISVVGLTRFAVVLLKTLAVVTLILIVLATAPLQDTLKAARALHVPALFVHLLLLTFRYVFLLAEEFGRLRTALRVRGFRNRADLHSWRTIGLVGGTLLVRGSERAERVGHAMRCRGFDGTFRSLCDFRTRALDVALWGAVILTTGGLFAWDLWRR
ncbi:MAG: cobalt ECF transporter T component CbiQ [Gemmataceae bacterium]|nr:cobalt ECF transporter T component CbiQ [Gemmataceae bacterium]